jgi:hypothetical protein
MNVHRAATTTEARRLTPSSQAEGRNRGGKARHPHRVNRVRVSGSQLYTYNRILLHLEIKHIHKELSVF